MVSSREGLIAGLCQRGLTQAEAEAEVSQREAEAERIVAAEGPLGREAAVAKARALLFVEEPIYVTRKPREQPKPAIGQDRAVPVASRRRPPDAPNLQSPAPQVATPTS